jgi:hypothetical protein
MSPTTEQLILMKLTGIEERQIEQGEAIAEIKGKMAEGDRYCGDCKKDINHNFDIVYDRVRQVEIDRAKNAGVKAGKQEAEADDDKKLSRWTMIIGFAFSAGASLASIWQSWPQIKKWLALAVQ